jgi:hypothetical protein
VKKGEGHTPDCRVRSPYKRDNFPTVGVIAGDLGAAYATMRQAERLGKIHEADRARRLIRQLEDVMRKVDERTCVVCGRVFGTASGRKTHAALDH